MLTLKCIELTQDLALRYNIDRMLTRDYTVRQSFRPLTVIIIRKLASKCLKYVHSNPVITKDLGEGKNSL